MCKKKGFTLIEIIVSVTIIMVLTAIGIVSYVSINENARDAKRRGDIEQIRTALEFYRTDNGYYPSTGDGTFVNVSGLTGLLSTYIPLIPSDPKGATNPYMYQAKNISSGKYYGYCLYAAIENASLANTICDPKPTGYTYGAKNP